MNIIKKKNLPMSLQFQSRAPGINEKQKKIRFIKETKIIKESKIERKTPKS